MLAATLWAQVGGSSPIVAPGLLQQQSQAPANVTVNVTPPPPDPVATQAMYDFVTANDRYSVVEATVGAASALLGSTNIWTNTPTSYRTDGAFGTFRRGVRLIALGLFLVGIIWTGGMLAVGSLSGLTSYQQLLPLMLAGFLLAMYADLLVVRSIALNNWMCDVLGQPSLADFSSGPLTLPARPEPPTQGSGPLQLATGFVSGLIGSAAYAIVLIVLEVKLVYRQAVLTVTDVAMPAAAALWAFKITRRYGSMLFTLFFGWLFGQPLVVLCMGLASTLLGLMNLHDGPAEVLIKLAVLLVAMKAVSLFAGGGLGSGGIFGVASLLLLVRRTSAMFRGAGASPPPPAASSGITVPGTAAGTGAGTAATGRAWRPAFGTA